MSDSSEADLAQGSAAVDDSHPDARRYKGCTPETTEDLATRTEDDTANEAILRLIVEESLGAGHLGISDTHLASDYVGDVARMPDLPQGPAGFEQFVSRLRGAMFDLVVTIDGVVARGGVVVARWTASGRHERPILGFEPTCVIGDVGRQPGGRRVTLSAITVARVEEAEIQESRTEWTALGFHEAG